MLDHQHVSVIIPALNEENAIGTVVAELYALKNDDGSPLIDDIIVADNGSTDNTANTATAAGARVIFAAERGYGSACLAAMSQLQATDIVLFVDGDRSCRAEQARDLLQLIHPSNNCQLAIGSRTLGHSEKGALTPPQRMGNWLASHMISLLWQQKVTDLGPYRAIRADALTQLDMQDRAFGWTVEMQVKAIQHGMTTMETPVDSLRRIGESKISGTLRGVIGAGLGIFGKIGALWWQQQW